MERSPRFKGAHALQVLAFEPQPDVGFRGRTSLPSRADKILCGSGCGSEGGEGGVCEEGGEVDVGCDEVAGGLDGGASEGQGRCEVCHVENGLDVGFVQR